MPMSHLQRTLSAVTLALAGALFTAPAAAQSVTREACTTGDLTVCAQVTLSATVGASTSELLFQVSNLGVFAPLEQASRPSILWSFAFATGNAAFDQNDVLDYDVYPVENGNASVSDDRMWTFSDYGDQWSLTYPSWNDPDFTTLGIGSSVPFGGTALDEFGYGWRQMGTTGTGGSIDFSLILPYAVDASLEWFQIFGLEGTSFEVDEESARVSLNGTCGNIAPCASVPATAVPEPSGTALLLIGAALITTLAHRRMRYREDS
jgi:hypothetical protein